MPTHAASAERHAPNAAGFPGIPTPTLILASASPRRARLLRDAGFHARAEPPPIDDATLDPAGRSPERWVTLLARLKARLSLTRSLARGERALLILAADTIVLKDGAIIGQPRDRADAERILRLLRDGRHTVLTAAALVSDLAPPRTILDSAAVAVGHVPDADLAPYLDSGDWRGKAGAYNLEERLAAAWPIAYTGDPATIMGLPMRRLAPILRDALARARGPS
jgi:septum formation protein